MTFIVISFSTDYIYVFFHVFYNCLVMEGAIIAKCTFESKTLLIPIFNHTKFEDIAEQICSRFVGLSPEVMELTYSLGDHQSCLLQSGMDVSVMKFSCCAENIASIPVSVSMVEPIEQLDLISFPHDKQILHMKV